MYKMKIGNGASFLTKLIQIEMWESQEAFVVI